MGKALFMVLLLYLLPSFYFPASTAMAQEVTYRITEAQLTALESSLVKLSALNVKQQGESRQLRMLLEASRRELSEVKQQSLTLESQLTLLKQESVRQESLLQEANKSLEKYAEEVKQERNKLKWQRNLAYLTAGILLYSHITK